MTCLLGENLRLEQTALAPGTLGCCSTWATGSVTQGRASAPATVMVAGCFKLLAAAWQHLGYLHLLMLPMPYSRCYEK